MNRIIFSLVSYFICLLFFAGVSQAAVFNVNDSGQGAAGTGNNGTLAYVIEKVNGAGVGPHTINITVPALTYYGLGGVTAGALITDNVTIIGSSTCTPGTNNVINVTGGTFTIQANNCVVKGIIFRRTSLTFLGNNNRVYGCWFNMDDTGNAANDGGGSLDGNSSSAIHIQGTGNIVGLSGQCRNIFSGVTMSTMVHVVGSSSNTTISNNYMGVAKDGATNLGTNLTTQKGVYFESGTQTGSRVDSNIIAAAGTGIFIAANASSLNIRNNDISNVLLNGIKIEGSATMNNLTITNNKIRGVTGTGIDGTDEADGFGIKLRDFTSNSVLVQGNLIGVQASGSVGTASPDLGCFKNGIYARANISALSIDNNVVCDNGNAETGREVCSGIFITANGTTFGSVSVTNNYVGVDKSGGKRGNDFAGINLRYVSGAFGSMNITSNVVGDNGANAGPSPQNPNPTRRSHGIALQGFYASSPANFKINSNYVGVFIGTLANIGNHANGIELYDCRNFTIGESGAGNIVGNNKFETTDAGFTGAGIMINGASQNGTIQSNTITGNINPTNTNPSLASTNSGITLEQSSGVTIGGAGALANTISNNNYGIQLASVGAVLSTNNSILGNTVSNNTSYGIYVFGGSGTTIGNASAPNIINTNAEGIRVINTTSINNKISQNQIYCNTGKGINLNYGASQGNNGQASPIITTPFGTNTVSGTAVANSTVELFAENGSGAFAACMRACGDANKRQGAIYIGSAVADASGNWTYSQGPAFPNTNLTATSTSGNNTSEFSTCQTLTICPPNANAGSNQTLCNVTTATLAGNDVSAAGGTGTWSTISGTGVATSPNSPTSGVTGLTVGAATVFQWTVSASGCPNTTAQVTITISAQPTAVAGTNFGVCNTTTTTLAGTAPSPGTGLWSTTSGTGVATTPGSATSGVTGLTIGAATVFKWTVTNGACSANASVTVTSSAAVTSNAGTAQNVCNSTTATLGATAPSPGTGAWTTTSGTGVATTPSSPTSGVTGLTVGAATTFLWTVTNGSCSATSSVTITSNASVTANAGSNFGVCNTTTATLAGSNPSPGTGAWTTTSGTGVATTPSSNTSGVTGLTVGAATVFKWTVTNGACTANASVTVTSSGSVTANAGTAQNVCNSTTATLAANNPSPGTGAWTTTSGTGVATTPSSNTSGVTGLTVGAASTFLWTVTNGTCSATSSVTITSNASVTANAGSNFGVCNTTTATLAGSNPSPGTGAWTTTSGTGIATTPSSNTSGVTGLTVGAATVFKWTVTNGACIANASVTVTSSAGATANAGTAQNVCNSTTATLGATAPSPGTGAWTTTSGTGVATTPSSPTSGVTGLTVGAATTFLWTVTNGTCSATSSVTITSNANVTANAGTDFGVCNTTTATLAGSNPSPGTGAWTTTSGSGVATTPGSNTSGITGLTLGAATVFRWTVTNGACTANASVTVTSSAGATANAGTAQSVCNSTTATLGATAPSPGTGAWTTTSGTGVATTPSSPTSGVTGLTVGAATTFLWTVTNGTCSATASVTITSDAPVTSNAGSNFGICNATTATLAGTTPAVGTGTWTVTSGSGNVTDIHVANSGVTGLTVGTTSTFQWVVTNGSCTSGASTVTITVSASPQSNAGSSQEVCNTTTGTLDANTTISSGTWTGPAGATFGDSHSPNTSVSGLTVGTNTFTWSVTNGYCTTAATSTTTITVDAPSQSSAGADQSFCNVTTASLNAGTSVGTGTWSGPAGVSITDPASPTSGVSGLAVGANVFTWSVKSGVCTAATSTMTITISAPGTTSAGPDQGLCNITTTTLAGSGSGTWTPVSGTGVLTNPSNANSGVTGLTVGGTSVFQWTVTSGACSGSAQVSVTVSAPPTGAAGTDQGLCNATATTLSATGTGTWTTASGTGVATDPTNTSSPVTGLTVGATSVFTWTVVNGFCSSSSNLSVVSSSPATSNAGSSSTLCNATTANLAATGTGTWTTTAGTGIVTTPTDPNSGVTALTPGQSSDFTWTVTSGNCSATSVVTITSSSPVTADAGPAQSLCNVTTATLAGVGTGTWTATAISGTGTVTDISNGSSGVTGLTVGTSSTFTWTVTNGACSNAANVTVSVSQGTTPQPGTDQTLCNTTSATMGASGTGTWSITAGAGTIVDSSNPATGVTVTTSPATFTWTINGGGCGSLSADVILTAVVLDKPIVSGSGTSGVCSGNTYTFSVTNVDAGATYGWTPSAVNSDVNLHTPTNTSSVDVDATSSDYIIVTADKDGCEDTTHAIVTVLPNPPTGGGTFHLATCADSLLLKTVLFDDNFYTGTWSSTDGGITFTPTTDSTFTLKNFTNGKDTLHFTVSGSCGTSTYTFYLQVGGEFLSAVMSGPSDTLCVGNNRELTMQVTPADTNNAYTYVWVTHVNFDHPVIDNTVHIDTTRVPVYNVSPDSDKNLYLGYVYDKYSGCRAAIDTARVYASTGQDLNVPNLITPNGDNQNDHWLLRDKVTHQDILPGSKFDLYNRWGQRVFTMDSYDNRFNASGISDGIYYFNLKAGCGGKEYKGWLQILGNTNP